MGRRVSCAAILLIACILMVACGSRPTATPPPSPPIRAPTSTATLTQTPTSTATITSTPTPTIPPTPRPTDTPTITPTPTPTATSIPTPTPTRIPPRPQAQGPLQVHPSNPRYFADGSGKAIYLTGSHNWHNLQDISMSDPPRVFDYDGYLDFMEQRNHNFMRMWRWEMPKYKYDSFPDFAYCSPHPWERTGPGVAGDGKPKFDLTRLDQAYFDRLRSRVIAAQERGIYVSVMLFEGHAMRKATYGWFSHPFHVDNNVNGIDGDLDGDGDPDVVSANRDMNSLTIFRNPGSDFQTSRRNQRRAF